ncbi:MAG: DUF4202 family protein [Labilithrix sp.]|nr:DUF4202 family protein [Labilithrix sp.]
MTNRFELLRLRLVGGDDDVDPSLVQREFPTIQIEQAPACDARDIVVDDYVWRGAFDLGSLDDRIEGAGPIAAISIRGYDVTGIACEVMTRYQRLLGRRNAASSTQVFDAVLRAHAGLYDVSLPLAKADLQHALDTWQWMLRLDPDAGLAAQLAALFHDVERLESEPRERIEHRAPDSQSLKDARVQRGVERAFALVEEAGVSREDATRARDIVFHERRAGDPDVLLLDDADALSFFSLSSAGYNDYFGVAQTRRKVAYTLARLGPRAREKLDRVRLRPDVERLLREVAA